MNEIKELKAQTDSQIYIGMPNGIVLCVDEVSGHGLRGCFYHSYSREPVCFENEDQLIFEMEKFFDSIMFPYPATNIRSFADEVQKGRGSSAGWQRKTSTGNRIELAVSNRQRQGGFIRIGERKKVMSDQELLGKHGTMGSFIVRVTQRQNSSMQGRLTWVDKNKTVYFRSVWELIRLIDSAVEIDHPSPEEELPSWED